MTGKFNELRKGRRADDLDLPRLHGDAYYMFDDKRRLRALSLCIGHGTFDHLHAVQQRVQWQSVSSLALACANGYSNGDICRPQQSAMSQPIRLHGAACLIMFLRDMFTSNAWLKLPRKNVISRDDSMLLTMLEYLDAPVYILFR